MKIIGKYRIPNVCLQKGIDVACAEKPEDLAVEIYDADKGELLDSISFRWEAHYLESFYGHNKMWFLPLLGPIEIPIDSSVIACLSRYFSGLSREQLNKIYRPYYEIGFSPGPGDFPEVSAEILPELVAQCLKSKIAKITSKNK